MSTLREAAQQALEALEETQQHRAYTQGIPDAITALRAALAQQEQEEQTNRAQQMCDAGYTRRPTLREMGEQEPVAWTDRELELIDGMIEVQLHHAAQCDAIANRAMAERQKGWDMERVALLRKIKSISPRHETEQEQAEPVLVVEKEPDYMSRGHFYEGSKPFIDHTEVWKLPIGTKLYTHPPRREWQGLSPEEINEIWYGAVMAQSTESPGFWVSGFARARAIEAKLKEKNNG